MHREERLDRARTVGTKTRTTPVTSWPARLICKAIGKPIAPTPMNVTFMITSTSS